MKNIIYAMKDLFKNFFNWRGRLSKEGYGWTWAGILIVYIGLIYIREAALFLALFSRYHYDKLISEIMRYVITTWNVVIFFPIMFATMRRYHDSGKAGWKVIIFNGLSVVSIVSGFFIGSFVVLAFVFAGGYMVTADADVKMSRLLGFVALSAFLFLAGVGFAILNIKYILQRSDPMENVYGKPIPFNPD